MNKLQLAINAAGRRLDNMFPGYFSSNTKHQSLYDEYGYPKAPTFLDFYNTYKRNGIANGAIEKTIRKTWQDYPWLLEDTDEVHDETTAERKVALAFKRLQFWSKLKDADRKAMVGRYSGIVFRFADNKPFREPVDKVPGGLDGLVELIPAFEAQLEVSDWDMDELSRTYGQPKMFQFNESAVGGNESHQRSFEVHPDRVHIWSEDFSVHGASALEPGLNALIDIEKIVGAGGEGFWKNAKNAPMLNMDKEADPQKLAAMLGVEVEDIAEKMDEHVADWQKGFDQLLMLQGIDAKTLGITLPDPEQFVHAPLIIFAASFGIPMKILVGSQSGERASTEDANEWAETNMGRREQLVKPNIERIIEKLVDVGVLPPVSRGWAVNWSDLTEAGADEKAERAKKLADINKAMMGRGEVYTVDEIREVTGHEPLDDEGDFDE